MISHSSCWNLTHGEGVLTLVKRKREHKNLPSLVQDLNSLATYVRRTAIIELAGRRSKDSSPHLQALLLDKEASIRACAAWALGELADPGSALGLAALLKDKDVEVRRSAARSLAQICSPASSKALEEARSDSDLWVAEWAGRALARLGNLPAARKRRRQEMVAFAPLELKP